MNKVDVLCHMNQSMMEAFSQQTITKLQEHTLFKLALPVFNSFLELNVRKEVDKDSRVIRCAAKLYQAGSTPTDQDVHELLRRAKEIDQTFLQNISTLPITINLNYAQIEKVRQQRMQILLHESYRVFTEYSNAPKITLALTAIYEKHEFKALLYDILHLYSLETRLLSRSVKMPSVMFVARDALTQTVFATMQSVAKSLVAHMYERVYLGKHFLHC